MKACLYFAVIFFVMACQKESKVNTAVVNFEGMTYNLSAPYSNGSVSDCHFVADPVDMLCALWGQNGLGLWITVRTDIESEVTVGTYTDSPGLEFPYVHVQFNLDGAHYHTKSDTDTNVVVLESFDNDRVSGTFDAYVTDDMNEPTSHITGRFDYIFTP